MTVKKRIEELERRSGDADTLTEEELEAMRIDIEKAEKAVEERIKKILEEEQRQKQGKGFVKVGRGYGN